MRFGQRVKHGFDRSFPSFRVHCVLLSKQVLGSETHTCDSSIIKTVRYCSAKRTSGSFETTATTTKMIRLDEIFEMKDGWPGLYVIWHESDFKMSRTFKQGFLCGLGSVSVAKLAVFPIDRFINCGKSSQYSDPHKTVFQIIKKTHFNSLYPSLCRTVPQYALMFACYHAGRTSITDPTAMESTASATLKSGFCGTLAGPFATLVLYPLEVAHKHLMIDEGRHNRDVTLNRSFEYRYVEGGYRAFYQGMTLSMIGSAVYRGFYFGGYEFVKHFTGLREEKKEFKKLFPCALASTMFATALVHPIDALRMNYLTATYQAVFHYNIIGPFSFAGKRMTLGKYLSGLHWNLGKSISAAAVLAAFDLATQKLL